MLFLVLCWIIGAAGGGALLAFGGTTASADHIRAAATAGSVLLGTFLGFAQIPNHDLELMPDQDLAAFSLAFLGLGAALPLADGLTGLGSFNYAISGVMLVFLAGIMCWRSFAARGQRAQLRNQAAANRGTFLTSIRILTANEPPGRDIIVTAARAVDSAHE